MAQEYTLTCSGEDAGSRADYVLARYGPLSRNAVQRLITENRVTVNGRIARKNDRVSAGDILSAELPDPSPSEALPEDIPLDIVYEDGDLIVLNKPAGLVVHPAPGHESGTLVNALLHHCGESLRGIGGVTRPGIVHRIDKDTSGLLVAAKTDFAHTALSAALKRHGVRRVYHCAVQGVPKEDAFTVSAPLGRHPADRKRQAVLPSGGRDAVTHATVLARLRGFSHLQCELETGRTHQIRVHLAYKGYPIVGDPVYNTGASAHMASRQLLHAVMLSFDHPRTGRTLTFTVPQASDLQHFIERHREG